MTTSQTPSKTTAVRRQFQGDVVRVPSQKTIAVAVKTVIMHPKYRKQYTRTKVYQVHDEKQVATVGDRVLFEECRPVSKTKRWRLIKTV